MNSGSYLQRFHGINSGASTPKDDFLDDNYSDSGSITKGRQLSLETNKRRRVMAMKIKENVEQEEKRRKEILAKRRQEQKIITEKFQRKRRSLSARKAQQHQQGTLEDALQAVKNSGSDHKIVLKRAGSFDSLQARIDPWAVEQDARKNRPCPWEIEQEVLIKNNHTYREKYGGGYTTKPTLVEKTPQSIFEKKLEKHQNSVLMKQQKELQEFSKALEQAFDLETMNSDSRLSPKDSLEDGEDIYPPSKVNSSINSSKSSENDTYRVLSCEDFDPDAVIQDPNLFLPLRKSSPPSHNPESTNGFVKHTYVNSTFAPNQSNHTLNNPSKIYNHQPDLFDASSSSPTNNINNKTMDDNDRPMEADSQASESTPVIKSSKIPVPVSSPVKEPTNQSQKTNTTEIKSILDNNEPNVRFVIVNDENEEDNDDQPSVDSSCLSTAQKPKGILKTLKTSSSDSSLVIHSLKGEYLRDSIDVAHHPNNSSTGKDNLSSTNSTAREQKSKSVRFAENLEEDLEANFVRLCQLQGGDQATYNGLPPRSFSAPVNRGRGKSSNKRNNIGSFNATRPPRAPKRSTAPKMVSLFGMPVKLRSTRPQKITSSTLDRLINTNNEEKEEESARCENEEEINRVNQLSNHTEIFPPDSIEFNGNNSNVSASSSNRGGGDDLVFSPQPSRILSNEQGPRKIERYCVDNVDLSVSEQQEGDLVNQPNRDAPFDPSVGHTPTEAEIDQLWEHVRSCLKPTPAPDSATASDLSVISAPNSFRRQMNSPAPIQQRTNSNAWTTEQQQNFRANQNRIQAQLSQGLRIIHHTSSAPAKRTPLSIQRDTRSKQVPVSNQTQSSDKITESLAEFLNAERVCESPGDREDHQPGMRQLPQAPQNLLITRKRMVARQQMSPVSLTPVMSPVPQAQNPHPFSSPSRNLSASSQRGNPPSALSVEEERIMKSLDRLNDRLNTVTLQN